MECSVVSPFEVNSTRQEMYIVALLLCVCVQVRLDAPTHCPPWLIEQINIDSPTSGHTHQFPCGRGLSPGVDVILKELCNTGDSSLALTNPGSQDLTGVCACVCVCVGSLLRTDYGHALCAGYEVRVYTSDKKGGGTSDNLHIILRGDHGSSKPFTVKNRSMFRRGQIDSFQLATPPLGPLQSVQVAHSAIKDGPEGSTSWHLFQVTLRELATYNKYTFPWRQWVPASQGTLNYVTLSRADK